MLGRMAADDRRGRFLWDADSVSTGAGMPQKGPAGIADRNAVGDFPGLGPQRVPTLCLVMFVGLLLVNLGLDEVSNPRL